MKNSHRRFYQNQQGAVLAIALIFLLIIALLGTLTLNTSFFERIG